MHLVTKNVLYKRWNAWQKLHLASKDPALISRKNAVLDKLINIIPHAVSKSNTTHLSKEKFRLTAISEMD